MAMSMVATTAIRGDRAGPQGLTVV